MGTRGENALLAPGRKVDAFYHERGVGRPGPAAEGGLDGTARHQFFGREQLVRSRDQDGDSALRPAPRPGAGRGGAEGSRRTEPLPYRDCGLIPVGFLEEDNVAPIQEAE